jgi:hypothetical protein
VKAHPALGNVADHSAVLAAEFEVHELRKFASAASSSFLLWRFRHCGTAVAPNYTTESFDKFCLRVCLLRFAGIELEVKFQRLVC